MENSNIQMKAWKEHEAAAYLGMSVGTLRHWRHIGKGPRYLKYQESQAVRYLKNDLDMFMNSSVVNPWCIKNDTSIQS